jgi:hypothetical protein
MTEIGATSFSTRLRHSTESAPLAVIDQVSSQNNARNCNSPNVKNCGLFKNDAHFRKSRFRKKGPLAQAVTMLL